MIIRRKGALRNEGFLETQGRIKTTRRRRTVKAGVEVVAEVPYTPDFYLGNGMYDWEVVLSTPEIGRLLSALAAAAHGPYRRSIARDLRPHIGEIGRLHDACKRYGLSKEAPDPIDGLED